MMNNVVVIGATQAYCRHRHHHQRITVKHQHHLERYMLRGAHHMETLNSRSFQRNVLIYTTTHKEQFKTQALSTHDLRLV